MMLTVHDWQAIVDVLKCSVGVLLLLSAFVALPFLPDQLEP